MFRVKEMRKSVDLRRTYSQKETLPIGYLIIEKHLPMEESDNSLVKPRLSVNTLKSPLRQVKKVEKPPRAIESYSLTQLKHSIKSVLKDQESVLPEIKKGGKVM